MRLQLKDAGPDWHGPVDNLRDGWICNQATWPVNWVILAHLRQAMLEELR
jgi:hypothetical protein